MSTRAHFQTAVLNQRLKLWYPEHEPRTTDPYYPLFNAAKRALKAHNVPCWRCGVTYAALNKRPGMRPSATNPLAAYQLEAHHSAIEFSLANAVDVEKWWRKEYQSISGFVARHPEFEYALDLSDDPAHSDYDPDPNQLAKHRDVFRRYVESDANLTQLCDVCHRSREQGIHWIPEPDWRALAYWRQSLPSHVHY